MEILSNFQHQAPAQL